MTFSSSSCICRPISLLCNMEEQKSKGQNGAGCTDQLPFQHRKGRNTWGRARRGTEIHINLTDPDLNSSTHLHETNLSETPYNRNSNSAQSLRDRLLTTRIPGPCKLGSSIYHLPTLVIHRDIILKILRSSTANQPVHLSVILDILS